MSRRSRRDLEVQPVQLVRTPDPAEFPPPPTHLSEQMQQWWRQVLTDYSLDQHHLLLLQSAAEAWDEMVRAREILAREGLTVLTKTSGPKRHPCADIERDARLAFARLLRELDLDADAPPPERGPNWRPSPALRSNRRR
jgi:P27 family predicted phage terminase small subunit